MRTREFLSYENPVRAYKEGWNPRKHANPNAGFINGTIELYDMMAGVVSPILYAGAASFLIGGIAEAYATGDLKQIGVGAAMGLFFTALGFGAAYRMNRRL